MASAPRDGTRIIGWFGDRCIVVFWRSGPEYLKRPGFTSRWTGNTVWYWSDGFSRFREPDCWQPEPEAPDAAQFPSREPPPKPIGPTRVVRSPKARQRLVEHKPKRERIREALRPPVVEPRRDWCGQCERNVTAAESASCTSPFCKAKATAA